MSKELSPLQTGRFYKVKKPSREFLCALCSAPREMKYSRNLSMMNYAQVVLLSITVSWLVSPWLGVKSLFAICIILPAFEVTNKILYRKGIGCPYCGFDATWYRRDVTVAKRLVKDYWQNNFPDLVNKSEELGKDEPVMFKENTVEDVDASQEEVVI